MINLAFVYGGRIHLEKLGETKAEGGLPGPADASLYNNTGARRAVRLPNRPRRSLWPVDFLNCSNPMALGAIREILNEFFLLYTESFLGPIKVNVPNRSGRVFNANHPEVVS